MAEILRRLEALTPEAKPDQLQALRRAVAVTQAMWLAQRGNASDDNRSLH